tara:strand:- start:500 stop:1729 length:1230 start_codon:yes stop_codon:yes gene_type:complete
MAEVIKMPRLSDTMTDGVVAKWHKKIGDKIQEGDLLADIETDKATMEFESFQEGFLLHIGVKENETAEVDSILAILGDKDEDVNDLLNKELNTHTKVDEIITDSIDIQKNEQVERIFENKKLSHDDNNTGQFVRISPLAKKIAKEKNLDINSIQGSGDLGRIIKRDVDGISTNQKEIKKITNTLAVQDLPVSQMRKTIADRLSQSKFTAPHFYLNIEVEMDSLIESRKLINEKNNIKISFNDILVKAVSMAIRKHPYINSSWLDTHIRLNQDINIGIAVALENGLVVPVIRNADSKSFSDISSETNDFVSRAKENKLQPSDWEANTFTISNLGMFGVDDFTAIINPNDACILAVGSIKERPIVKDGNITSAHIMRLTLSCDHRVVDGVVGSKFLNTLKNMLESPMMMFC